MARRNGLEIAIIGMAARFPMARDVDEFWDNLRDSKECISRIDDETLLAQGIARELFERPDYVRGGGFVEGEDLFDAAFFDFSPRDAELIDPQQRLFLECCWTALEHAGHRPDGGVVGVYAGAGTNTYRLYNLSTRSDLLQNLDPFQVKIASDVDFLATRVCYKLNLLGPGVTLQTACSTSLVAIHVACQGLLSGACDVALAGGVAVRVPQRIGALYQPDHILSPDAHCRAFDAQASGTVGGNGAGVVVLKRLEEAIADGDAIHAVIKGSAINNDGSKKVGYSAPSETGQAQVIRDAQIMAEVEPETITYVEAHGTGTSLGDPIEIAALTQAFRSGTDQQGFCAIGSVKTNIGHLDVAAGVAGVIKTALALERGEIPASLHFTAPNPKIDFASSPFFVNDRLRPWPRASAPRRAGVSSFGIGGTNAHAVLEEAPEPAPSDPGRSCQLLVLSAKTPTALDTLSRQLAAHLRAHPEQPLADVAHTLQIGRKPMRHRRLVVAHDGEEAAAALAALDPRRVIDSFDDDSGRTAIFLFPGQGAQYPGMARALYDTEPVLRTHVDRCAEILAPHLELDLRDVLFPEQPESEIARDRLRQTALAQPALFALEYALAQLLMTWGLAPQAMIGHSIGEYVAACLSGVLSLEDALALVAARGRLMQTLPAGAMLSVPLAENELLPLLGPELALAAVNGPALATVSGPAAAVDELAARLAARGVETQPLHTSHAFHSAMMDPILPAFRREVEKVALGTPRLPYVSNLSGTWISVEQACNPEYWVEHLRRTVRFGDGAARLLAQPRHALIEVGPGRTLGTFLKQVAGPAARLSVQPVLRHPKDPIDDVELLATSLGKLWLEGVEVDWAGYHRHERRRRLPLPTYPFERRRYWIERASRAAPPAPAPAGKRSDRARWLYLPSWKRTALFLPPVALEPGSWLVFADDHGLADELATRLRGLGQEVDLVTPGTGWGHPEPRLFTIDPAAAADYRRLLRELRAAGREPRRIVHLFTLAQDAAAPKTPGEREIRAFWSLLYLAQALGEQSASAPLELTIVGSGLHDFTGEEPLIPEHALALGPCRVIPQEHPQIACRSLELRWRGAEHERGRLAEQLLAELVARPAAEPVVAFRGRHRWVQIFEPASTNAAETGRSRLRPEGVYLITGGLGGIGLALAGALAKTAPGAKLILLGRSSFPAREQWPVWLAEHEESDPIARTITQLRELEALGAELLVASADVAREDQMRAVLELARERFGELHGVVHAAGVAAGGILQNKTDPAARAVLAPKVEGTRVLGELVRDAELDFFVVCSSLAAIWGGLGQVDYAAANAFEDAYVQSWAQTTGRPAVAIDWDTWSEVGMAAQLARRGSDAAPSFRRVDHPLLDACVLETASREVYVTRFGAESRRDQNRDRNRDRNWVLAEHRIGGRSLLPGTAYLELALAAFGALEEGVEMSEVAFLRPFLAPEDEGGSEVRTLLEGSGEGTRFTIASEIEHARGKLRRCQPPADNHRDLAAIRQRCDRQTIVFDETTALRHGPHWHGSARIDLGAEEMLAEIALPAAFATEVGRFVLHPSLMDVATSFFIREAAGEYLPVGYQLLRIHRPLPARVFSHVRQPAGQKWGQEVLSFDVDLTDEHGELLVAAAGYSLRLVSAAQLQQLPAAAPAKAAESAENPTSVLLADRLEHGLRTAEGVEVFERILGRPDWRQVLVSTRDLEAELERARSLTLEKVAELSAAAPAHGERHTRPQLSSELALPRDPLEGQVAEIWSELLGVDPLGIHDDFFELGGHSLLGIQVASRLRSTLGIELPVSAIFEHRTVAQLTAAIGGMESTPLGPEIRREEGNVLQELAGRVDELDEHEIDALLLELAQEEQRVS